jgi:tetratricopeptide (TPR) repeat protein
MFGTLGSQLVAEDKKDKAIEAMDYAVKSIPDYNVPYDFYSMNEIATTYLLAGDTSKALQINDKLLESITKELDWYSRLNNSDYMSVYRDVRSDLYYMGYLLSFYQLVDPEKYAVIVDDYNRFINRFENISNRINKGGANR